MALWPYRPYHQMVQMVPNMGVSVKVIPETFVILADFLYILKTHRLALKLGHICTKCGRTKDINYSDMQYIVCVVFQVWLTDGNTLFQGLLVLQKFAQICLIIFVIICVMWEE